MAFKILYESVIKNKLCCFCGACVAVCPENCIAFFGSGPKLESHCTECGKCVEACPGNGAPLTKLMDAVLQREETEDEKKGGLGAIIEDRNLVSADPEILNIGYTGGKVTALLAYLIENRKIDGAIVTASGDSTPYPHFAWPRIAETKKAILQCGGSKYMFSPNLMLLKELAENDDLKSVAFVGLGCHVMGIRKLQLLGDDYRHLVEKISYVFGLFCGRAMLPSDDFLMLVAKLCETTVEEIDSVNFHRVPEETRFMVKYEVRLKNGQIKSREILIDHLFYMISLLDQWHRCRMCLDYASEFADVSFGGTHIISRTPTGEQLVQNALADGILVPQTERFRLAFEENAHKMDSFMIRLKKTYNLRRIKKNVKKRQPVPEFEENISEV